MLSQGVYNFEKKYQNAFDGISNSIIPTNNIQRASLPTVLPTES